MLTGAPRMPFPRRGAAAPSPSRPQQPLWAASAFLRGDAQQLPAPSPCSPALRSARQLPAPNVLRVGSTPTCSQPGVGGFPPAALATSSKTRIIANRLLFPLLFAIFFFCERFPSEFLPFFQLFSIPPSLARSQGRVLGAREAANPLEGGLLRPVFFPPRLALFLVTRDGLAHLPCYFNYAPTKPPTLKNLNSNPSRFFCGGVGEEEPHYLNPKRF